MILIPITVTYFEQKCDHLKNVLEWLIWKYSARQNFTCKRHQKCWKINNLKNVLENTNHQ